MRPATCTHVTLPPDAVRKCSALRSFSSDALSTAAFTKLPAWYHAATTSPSTGLRFEWTLNTFMNTLILSASRSRYGSRVFATLTILPSAGESTALDSRGTRRAGSRKN
jgi:hypothetical protein